MITYQEVFRNLSLHSQRRLAVYFIRLFISFTDFNRFDNMIKFCLINDTNKIKILAL